MLRRIGVEDGVKAYCCWLVRKIDLNFVFPKVHVHLPCNWRGYVLFERRWPITIKVQVAP